MATAIIHIGMHKTGSSSIQASLYDMRHTLTGFHYLDMGVDNPTGKLFDAFLYADMRLQQLLSRGVTFTVSEILERKKKELEQFKKQVGDAQGKDLIISAEGLCHLSLDQLTDMKDILDPFYDEFKVVTYVRPPMAFMSSLFQQHLKGNFQQLNLSRIWPNYRERFEKFETLFGDSSVEYWMFNPAHLLGRCVVTDFCTRLCIPFDKERVIRQNEGLSLNAAVLLYIYRLYGPGFGTSRGVLGENNRLVEKLATLKGPKLQFSEALLADLLREKREDISWMEERMGPGALLEQGLEGQGISLEKDLEKVPEDALSWLAEELGYGVSEIGTREQVAAGVQKLREKIEKQYRVLQKKQRLSKNGGADISGGNTSPDVIADSRYQKETIDAKTIAADVIAKKPIHASLSKGIIEIVISTTFEKILRSIEECDEGNVRISSVGVFKIRKRFGKAGKPEAAKEKRRITFSLTAKKRKN